MSSPTPFPNQVTDHPLILRPYYRHRHGFDPGRVGPSLPHLSWQIPHVRLVPNDGCRA